MSYGNPVALLVAGHAVSMNAVQEANMTPQTSAVLASAMQLSESERAELTDLLVDTLDPPAGLESVSEDDLADEIARRAAELKADPNAGLSWKQVWEM
jgi:putative addiction module component (TIGR02574 family)